jgi:ParB family chromosome partitioning protein
MRHDRHFVEELANQSVLGVGFMVPIDRIETNRQQPRTNLGDLSELTASVKARGVLEPLLVRRSQGSEATYELIAGERRFHAALEAGLDEVPCVELQATDQEALEIALVENLQRKDLTPFEEAEGYRTLVERYGYTHDRVAAAVGKSRPTVTEALKLLAIPPALRDLCRHADITAKSVLLLIARAASVAEMELLIQEIAERNLDRETARSLASEVAAAGSAEGAGTTVADEEPTLPDAGPTKPPASPWFRPIQIRFKPEGGRGGVHLSLSIRHAGISREEIIRTVEALLQRLRSGELDDHLSQDKS